jgi:hypothetical protein
MLLKKRENINPFNDSAKLSDLGTQNRLRHTIKFMQQHIKWGRGSDVLDIGVENEFGNAISALFGLNKSNTIGNLEYPEFYSLPTPELKWKPKSGRQFEVVTCFENVEHIVNVQLFLFTLRQYLSPNAQVFISYPARPKILWPNHHVHEYDSATFEYIVKTAKYKIVAYERHNIAVWKKFWRYFKGLRTPLRLYYERTELYCLEPMQW